MYGLFVFTYFTKAHMEIQPLDDNPTFIPGEYLLRYAEMLAHGMAPFAPSLLFEAVHQHCEET